MAWPNDPESARLVYQHVHLEHPGASLESLRTIIGANWTPPVECRICGMLLSHKGASLSNHAKCCLQKHNSPENRAKTYFEWFSTISPINETLGRKVVSTGRPNDFHPRGHTNQHIGHTNLYIGHANQPGGRANIPVGHANAPVGQTNVHRVGTGLPHGGNRGPPLRGAAPSAPPMGPPPQVGHANAPIGQANIPEYAFREPPAPLAGQPAHVDALRPNGLDDFLWDYDDNPSLQQAEAMDSIFNDLSEGCYALSPGLIAPLRTVIDRLLSVYLSGETTRARRVLSSLAMLILPGLLVRLQRLKTNAAELRLQLLSWAGELDPSCSILSQGRRIILSHPRRSSLRSAHLRVKQVRELVGAHRLGTLLRAVEADATQSLAPIRSTREMQELCDLFHPAASEHDRVDDLPNPRMLPSLTLQELAFGLLKLPMGTAVGISGWSNRLLRQIYGDEAKAVSASEDTTDANEVAGGLRVLLRFLNSLLSGNMPDATLRRLNTARLVFIPKEQGERPIAIQDALLRLLLRCLNAKFASRVGEILAPLQTAVGISGGTEIMGLVAQHAYTSRLGILQVDIKAAFQTIHRRAIAHGLQSMCPDLLGVFKMLYGSAGELRAHTQDGRGQLVGLSARGCKQGDPLSTLFFAVGLHAALTRLLDLATLRHQELGLPPPILMAYADDIQVAGDPAALLGLVDPLRDILAHIGLTPNIAKSKLLACDGAHIPEGGIAVIRNGTIMTGIPVGQADFIATEADKIIAPMGNAAALISQCHLLDPQLKFALISKCVNARPVFISRNVHTNLINLPLSIFDQQMEQAVESLVGSQLNGPSAEILRLPVSQGGVGLKRHAGAESIHAFNSRIDLISPFLATHYPDIAALLTACGKTPFPAIPDSGTDAPITSIAEVHSQTFNGVLRALGQNDMLKEAFLRSGNVQTEWSCSGKWLLWMGGQDNRQRFRDGDAFLTALRQRLILPDHNAVLPCPNHHLHPHGQVDLFHSFMHTVRCQPVGGVSQAISWRHNTVVRALKDLIREVCFPPGPTPPQDLLGLETVVGQMAPVDDLPPVDVVADLVFRQNMAAADAHRYVFDVSIVEPTNRHGLGRPNGYAAEEAARAKSAKYACLSGMPGTTFVPFVIESNGHIGNQAANFLTAFTDKWPNSRARVRTFLNMASYAIAKGTGWAGSVGRRRAHNAWYHAP